MANAKKRTPRHRKINHCIRRLGQNQRAHTASATNNIPQGRQTPKNQPPEWAQKAKQWRTQTEWKEMQQHITERDSMRKQITEMAQKIRRQKNIIMLIQITNAWKQATTYLKANKVQIQYAKNPEPEPPEQGRKRPNTKPRQYRDEITQEGRKQDLNQGMIKIQHTERTQKMRKTYRDTTRNETLD